MLRSGKYSEHACTVGVVVRQGIDNVIFDPILQATVA